MNFGNYMASKVFHFISFVGMAATHTYTHLLIEVAFPT